MSLFMRESSGIGNGGFSEGDWRAIGTNKPRTLGKDAQSILDYLKRMQAENSNFFYAIQGDGSQGSSNIFWADARSREAYDYFGDSVMFDTSYKTNRYRLPFVTFSGVNHHSQPVLFGCALLVDESEYSLNWLFRTWLAAMSGRYPISIVTYHDRSIADLVTQVFPGTRHRFYMPHIFRKSQEILSLVYLSDPTFQGEFIKCVNQSETINEFELAWASLMDRYNLRENEWLYSLYNSRQQWVPVYLRDTFFAEISTTLESENGTSFFDGYINAQTTMQVFVAQYEKALDSRYEKEVKADYDTMNTTPILKTPSPMEKQAAGIYTRKIFLKFQEELVETLVYTANKVMETGAIATYRVAKFEVDHKANTVSFNASELRASCNCQMFEFSGILCRHVLTVFRVKNVLTLPAHYILKRWTRNAKAAFLNQSVDIQGNTPESIIFKYNTFRHEAIKYAEDGAMSIEIYNVAMKALQEAAKKVASAKQSGSSNRWIDKSRDDSDWEKKGSEVNLVDEKSNQIHNYEKNIGGVHQKGLVQSHSMEIDKDKKIQELMFELDRAYQICADYRAELLLGGSDKPNNTKNKATESDK